MNENSKAKVKIGYQGWFVDSNPSEWHGDDYYSSIEELVEDVKRVWGTAGDILPWRVWLVVDGKAVWPVGPLRKVTGEPVE